MSFMSILPYLILGGTSLFNSMSQQDRQSFSKSPNQSIHPDVMLGDLRSMLRDITPAFKERASRPVQLRSAYAQNVPTFTGGGMPMPVGLYGEDPALKDPSLLTLPGFNMGQPNAVGSQYPTPTAQNPSNSGVGPGGGGASIPGPPTTNPGRDEAGGEGKRSAAGYAARQIDQADVDEMMNWLRLAGGK